MANPGLFYTVGGTVQASGGIYIPRQADQDLLQLCREGAFAYILTPRQMGKSSLMVQTAEQLRQEGIRAVIIDLTQLGVQQVTAEQWYLGLLTLVEEQLMLETDVVRWWQERTHLSFTQRMTQFFKKVLLGEVAERVVIFVDEIDSTLSLDFTDDFFAAIRYLYVARAQEPAFKRLSFVLIGVATPGDLIRDSKRTPFNVGQRVDLMDFTLEQAMPLAAGLNLSNPQAEQVMAWVLKWTGGHPYLTQRLCSALVESWKTGASEQYTEADVERVVSGTFFGEMSLQDNNLQFVRDMLTKRAPDQAGVLQTYRTIRWGRESVIDEEQSLVKNHLKLSGVVKREGTALGVRNAIYRKVFDLQWIQTHLPETLWQRPFYTVGGTVQGSGGIYISREADQDLLQLCREGAFVYILTPRQMGKSSLMVQTAERLSQEGIRSVVIDLTQLGVLQVTAQQWYLGLLTLVEEQLMPETDVVRWWQERTHLSFTQRMTQFFKKVLLTEVAERVVIFVDEIDSTLRLDFTDDFFAAIQFLYVARAQEPAFGRLSFVLIGVATPGDLIRDSKRTPFNVGQRVDLMDFTLEQAMPLAAGLNLSNPQAEQVMAWVLEWTGGHPYLTQRLCGALVESWKTSASEQYTEADVERVVSGTFFGEMSLQDNNLQFVRDMLTKCAPDQAGVLQTYRTIRWGRESVIDEEQSLVKNHLKLSGVVKREGTALDVRNAIYRKVFDPQWIQTQLPETLWQRLKPAMPLIANLLVFSVLITVLAVYADRQCKEAVKQTVVAQLREQSARALNHSVAFSPDGRRIVSGSSDGSLRLWNAQTGQPIAQPLQGHTDSVLSVAFSPDGSRIVSGSHDGSVRLWNAQTGQPIAQPLQGHTDSVNSVAFSPDGSRIVSGSLDGSVRLWNAQTGQPISQPLQGHTDSVLWVAFSPDGRRIVSGSSDRSVRLWDPDWSSWLAIACKQLRYHPLLNQPQTVVTDPDFLKAAGRARAICQQEVWGRE